jgi:stress response protein YsnF
LKDLIVVLSHQVAQIVGEVTATKNELTATKNELTAAKNELIANKGEVKALRTELTATIQMSNIQVPTSVSPSYAAIARTPPNSQPRVAGSSVTC